MGIKKLTLVVLILFSSMCYSQDSIAIAPELEEYVMEFVKEGSYRGDNTYFRSILEKVDTIKLDGDLNYPMLGYYQPSKRTVSIASYTLIDPVIVRFTVFHELGHVLRPDKDHPCTNCNQIMSNGAPETFVNYHNPDFWALRLDELFIWIKE